MLIILFVVLLALHFSGLVLMPLWVVFSPLIIIVLIIIFGWVMLWWARK